MTFDTQGLTKTAQVLDAGGTIETRQIKTGLSNDQFTEITSGLQPGDKVVIPATSTAATTRLGGPGIGGPPPF